MRLEQIVQMTFLLRLCFSSSGTHVVVPLLYALEVVHRSTEHKFYVYYDDETSRTDILLTLLMKQSSSQKRHISPELYPSRTGVLMSYPCWW